MSDSKSNSSRSVRKGGINATFIGCIFLGLCILIAGMNIGGSIKKLNKTMIETQFADTNTVVNPSSLTLSNKQYLTESEAAIYLNISKDKVLSLISKGAISEYVKTENGYSISVKVLDEWFDNEAYQTKLNSAGTKAKSEDD